MTTDFDQDEERADAMFHALADRTRRDILRRVLAGEHSVSALAASYDMSFAAVQKHVAVLEAAELVSKERRGREQIVRSNVETIRRATELLDQLSDIWHARVDRIGELLAEDTQERTNDEHEG